MDDKPHLVKVPKAASEGNVPGSTERFSEQREGTEQGGDVPREMIRERKGIPTKVVALIIVAIVVGAGGLYLWAEYVRHWTTEEVADQVILDPTEAAPGFEHSLAGRTVTVEGKLTNVSTYKTTLGSLSFLTLDNFEYIRLVDWGDVSHEVGKRMEMRVHFEWAKCNDELHVYSPQIDFPWAVLPSVGIVQDAVSHVRGSVFVPKEVLTDSIRVEVFDQYPETALADANCSLKVGTASWAGEYLDVLGWWDFGREIDSISNLSQGASENDLVHFVDADSDGFISSGDWFDLSSIERPEEKSGFKTYMLVVGLTNLTETTDESDKYAGSSYLVISHGGLLRYLSGEQPLTPYARGSVSVVGNEAIFTCVRLMEPVSWNDIEICVHEGLTFEYWYPWAEGLNGSPSIRQDLDLRTIGTLQVYCTVVDVAGNGMLDEGDYFVLTAPNGYASAANYTGVLMFEPTHSQMFEETFQGS